MRPHSGDETAAERILMRLLILLKNEATDAATGSSGYTG
jgi:hypothetical protein